MLLSWKKIDGRTSRAKVECISGTQSPLGEIE
ncbi:hypothetical protein X740_28620 [Mesorhizobium sp. LNHC221B00]|nr:hypothetical protein X740_28620 [Mesorhizobium sp. LNHC221B00]